MIELDPGDFLPLDHMKFQHWIHDKELDLPEIEWKRIHLLTQEKAKKLYEYARRYFTELSRPLFPEFSGSLISSPLYEWIRLIDFRQVARDRWDDIGRETLLDLHSQVDKMVIVLWTREEALAVDWRVFHDYWSEFCIIGLEDVIAFPLSERWYLLYYHEDRMLFGRTREPLLDQEKRQSLVEEPKPLLHNEKVLQLLVANEKVAAIKLYQQETGVGYKQAIEAVNKLLANVNLDSEMPN
jgi:hypothetical protein